MGQEQKNKNDTGRSALGNLCIDLLAVASFVSLVYGCWLIYPAAGYIVGGALGLSGALQMARSN